MSKPDKDQVIAKFTAAYEAANGKAPIIEAKGGWYSVDGGKNMRLAALDELANELSGGAAEEASSVESEEPAASAETAPAPTLSEKKPATGGFSVKSFWIEHLDEQKPGSTAPR